MKLDIIFENDDYVCISKPSGLLSIADRHNAEIPSAHGLLSKVYHKIWIVHRIDRDTSGCICFAKNEEAHQHLNTQFEKRQVDKIYHAIVAGTLPQSSGVISNPIMEHPTMKGKMTIHQKQGKESITEYEVLEAFGKYSYVSCKLLTGRTHQIRVHLSNLGNPILCDSIYGLTNPIYVSSIKKNYHLSVQEIEERPILNRLSLHAYELCFKDMKDQEIRVQCELPKDLSAFLKQCRKWLKR
jgi:23S rRNA pseudouridine1911/1915/1917 synthase